MNWKAFEHTKRYVLISQEWGVDIYKLPSRWVKESKFEADSSRSDIRVFEIGLSSQQYGDYEQGTRNAAYEAESARLISIAKEKGLFISPKEWMRFGDRKRLPSGESIVYLNPQGNRIIKVRNPFAKSAIKQLHAQDAIYEHLIHNSFQVRDIILKGLVRMLMVFASY